jgi:FixJ family two-component response regulator
LARDSRGGSFLVGTGMTDIPLVHVVDDDDALRTSLLRLLRAAGFEVRGYASTGDFLLEPPPDRPGCLLLDVRMPGPSGLELQSALKRMGIPLPVVFLTGHADVMTSVQAMKAGAVDFLEKPVQRVPLLDALRRALELGARQRAARDEERDLLSRIASLSAVERKVFDQVASGKLNKQIAYDLGIAERTVKLHRSNLMAKLGADSPAELGSFAERLKRLPEEI